MGRLFVVFAAVLLIFSILFLLPGTDAPLWVWLLVGVFPAILGLITIMSPRRTQMVLNKTSGRLELRRKMFFRYQSQWFDLANIDLFYASQRLDIKSAATSATRYGYLNVRIDKGMDLGSYNLNTYKKHIHRVRMLARDVNDWREAA
ncbi:hypothetical protein N8Z63_06280 [Octadecabacter sp.]|nr:hypothetical protein [Octadecabacter sp.]